MWKMTQVAGGAAAGSPKARLARPRGKAGGQTGRLAKEGIDIGGGTQGVEAVLKRVPASRHARIAEKGARRRRGRRAWRLVTEGRAVVRDGGLAQAVEEERVRAPGRERTRGRREGGGRTISRESGRSGSVGRGRVRSKGGGEHTGRHRPTVSVAGRGMAGVVAGPPEGAGVGREGRGRGRREAPWIEDERHEGLGGFASEATHVSGPNAQPPASRVGVEGPRPQVYGGERKVSAEWSGTSGPTLLGSEEREASVAGASPKTASADNARRGVEIPAERPSSALSRHILMAGEGGWASGGGQKFFDAVLERAAPTIAGAGVFGPSPVGPTLVPAILPAEHKPAVDRDEHGASIEDDDPLNPSLLAAAGDGRGRRPGVAGPEPRGGPRRA